METLNFCVLTYSLNMGNGVDVSVLQFARELSKNHNVKLMSAQCDMDITGLDYEQHSVRGLKKIGELARHVKKGGYDYVSTHSAPMDIVGGLSDLPLLLHDPGTPPLRYAHRLPDIYNNLLTNGCHQMSSRKAHIVFPTTKYVGREFRRKHFYQGLMYPLPHGVDYPKPDDIAGLEKDYGNFALYVGANRPYKCVHELIKAFVWAKKGNEKRSLVLIGNPGPTLYQECLEKFARKVGDVYLLGRVQDVWPYYNACTLYATMSRWEGLDRPVLEAQYLGKPVVALDVGAHRETVYPGFGLARDGNEFLVKMAAYYSRICYVQSYDLKQFAEKFSVQNMVRMFIHYLKEMDVDEKMLRELH